MPMSQVKFPAELYWPRGIESFAESIADAFDLRQILVEGKIRFYLLAGERKFRTAFPRIEVPFYGAHARLRFYHHSLSIAIVKKCDGYTASIERRNAGWLEESARILPKLHEADQLLAGCLVLAFARSGRKERELAMKLANYARKEQEDDGVMCNCQSGARVEQICAAAD